MAKSTKELWMENVFDDFGGLILNYIKTIVGDAHQAEDVMQNVFIKLWKTEIETLSNVKAYVITAARNEALTYIRKRNKTHLRPIAKECQLFSREENTLRKMCIEEALLELPQEQREIVFLKIYAQLTFQKIADTLNIPLNTASSRYRYAMEKLSQILGEKNHE
ncbi:RNA polymerase sigma factor [Candidatus Uabimicrobium amorphum]|uniref:DNA-directed RNA polymerase sigma-70 factor n=1 Tax=Uabimicrobium amorphum TaxID=2596890 RepID=A0A5S9F481_UABAM|nr:sigma-70 family RNA polymerase sigma factor [Candidatus Uabimicrobium amorphum]BBM85262.1 DNA-directed RNA polymerase sigma-70 factor [Candidatus Uabimicrobium amorphum]